MRILYFIDSLTSGGAQRQAVELARRLNDRGGVKVSFLVYHDLDFFGSRVRESGMTVRLVPKALGFDAGFPLRLRDAFRAESPDLIHAFLLHPSAWGALAVRGLRRRRRPVLVAGERSAIGLGRGSYLVEHFAFRCADAVTANSEAVAAAIRRRHGEPTEGVHYLPNGIDLADWDARAGRPSPIPIQNEQLHVGLIGGLRAEKGHLILLDALSRIPSTVRQSLRVLLVGAETGAHGEAETIRAAISARKLDGVVVTTGATEAVPALLSRLDLLVLPSFYEGFPNVVLEAMASRVPVVASAVGEVPKLVEEGHTGFLVPPGDSAALADAILRVRTLSISERRAMGERARERVEREFQIEDVAAKYLDLYRRLVGSRGES